MASTTSLPIQLTADQIANNAQFLTLEGVKTWYLAPGADFSKHVPGTWGPIKQDENPGKVLVYQPTKTGGAKTNLLSQIINHSQGDKFANFPSHFKRKVISGTAVRLHNNRVRSKLENMHPVSYALYKALILLQGLTMSSGLIDNETLYYGAAAAAVYRQWATSPLTAEQRHKYSIPHGFDTVVNTSTLFNLLSQVANVSGVNADAPDFVAYKEGRGQTRVVLNQAVVTQLQNLGQSSLSFIDYIGFSLKPESPKASYSPSLWLTLIPGLSLATTLTLSNLLGLTSSTGTVVQSLFSILTGQNFDPLLEGWNLTPQVRTQYIALEEQYDREESNLAEIDDLKQKIIAAVDFIRNSKLKAPKIQEKKDVESKDLLHKTGKISFTIQLADFFAKEKYRGVNEEGKRTVISLSVTHSSKSGEIKASGKIKAINFVNGMRIYPDGAPADQPLVVLSVKTPDEWLAIQRFAAKESQLLQHFSSLFGANWTHVSSLSYRPQTRQAFGGFASTSQPTVMAPSQPFAQTAGAGLFSNRQPQPATMNFQSAPVPQPTQAPVPQSTQAPAFQAQPAQGFQPTPAFQAQPAQGFQPTPAFQAQPAQGLFSNGQPASPPRPNAYAQAQATQGFQNAFNNVTSSGLASPRNPSPGSMAQSVVAPQLNQVDTAEEEVIV